MPAIEDLLGYTGLALVVVTSMYGLFFSKASSRPRVTYEASQKDVPKTAQKTSRSWQERLGLGLLKTREEIWGKISGLLSKKEISEEDFERIEEILYASDMAPVMVSELLSELQENYKKNSGKEEEFDFLKKIREFLEEKMRSAQASVDAGLYTLEAKAPGTKVIMVVGVNGAGKTTTIGKLATKLKAQGAKVYVGACDTFRAAAVEQLEVWCQRAGVEMIKAQEGANPSGVAYETVEKAVKAQADYCIIDTAGRLHTATNLMEELAKTKRVMGKVLEGAPHDVLLVVDAITGQNAMRQAQEFHKTLNLTGLIFTKCDGSAKAGSAVSIVNALQVPVAYIGVGEKVEDLNRFNLDEYLNALLGQA